MQRVEERARADGRGAGGQALRSRDVRRWNATGNQFQEGRGPLPRRISRVKRADKCGHLRQRPHRRRCAAAAAPPAAFHTTFSYRNQSDDAASAPNTADATATSVAHLLTVGISIFSTLF